MDVDEHRNKVEALFDSVVSRAIDQKTSQIRSSLKEVEDLTRNNYLGQIAYHKLLMESAREEGNISAAMHHQVMIETFESILRSFSMAGSYDKI